MINFFEKKSSFNFKIIYVCILAFIFFLISFKSDNVDFLTFAETYEEKAIIIFMFELILLIVLFYIIKTWENIKFIDLFVFSIIVLLALVLRINSLDFESHDYNNFLSHWIEYLKDNGGFSGIATISSDYNVLYLYFLAFISYIEKVNHLYLIKYFSIIFDFVLAIYAMKIVGLFTNENKLKKILTFATVLLFPTVWLNGAYWAQCDSIYVAFILMSFYYMLVRKSEKAIVFFSIAFLFKLQTIFFLPMLGVFYLTNKMKLKDLLIIPIVFLINYIPAGIIGKSFKDYMMVYVSQTKTYSNLTLNAPSVYAWISEDFLHNTVRYGGIIFAVVTVVVLVYICFLYRSSFNKNIIILYTFLFSLIIPWLLPHMHDRYFFLAEVLSVIIGIIFLDLFYMPILMGITFFSVYQSYLAGEEIITLRMGSLIILSIIYITSKRIKDLLLKEIKID